MKPESATKKKTPHRQFNGQVVGVEAKTVRVLVRSTKLHPKYRKQYVTTKKYAVHDEEKCKTWRPGRVSRMPADQQDQEMAFDPYRMIQHRSMLIVADNTGAKKCISACAEGTRSDVRASET